MNNQSPSKQDAGAGLAGLACSPVCPRCGRPRTNEGQPSRRWFYACGSHLYEGEKILRDRTDICEAVEALNDAALLLNDIMGGECNAQDEAEKWLRAYAPQYLANEQGYLSRPGTSVAATERTKLNED